MATTAVRPENSGDSSTQQQSSERNSQSDDVLNEEDDVSKGAHNVAYLGSDGYGQEQQNFQHGAPNILARNENTLAQAPQPELVACAPNPYYDPYYGGMMAAYGQHMVHPQFLDMHQVRMPLPLEMTQEPVYVNAKQYNAILRRRQSRAKAELEKKLIKDRKPYLHESRHQHAMRRMRSSGGRFAKKNEVDKNSTSSSSSGMKRVNSESNESLNTHQETSDEMANYCNGRTYEVDGGRYDSQEKRGSIVDSYQLGEGGSLGQQWTTIPSNQASQRAVAMK